MAIIARVLLSLHIAAVFVAAVPIGNTQVVDNTDLEAPYYNYDYQPQLVYYLDPYTGRIGAFGASQLGPRQLTKRAPTVKRERIVMDAMGGDYLIKKRSS